MRAIAARQARHLLFRRSTLPSCAVYATPPRCRLAHRPSALPRQTRRTFFGAFFRNPPPEIRAPVYEPGWKTIILFQGRIQDNLRPPPRKDLLDAWKELMKSKRKTKRPFNSTQALRCRRLLEYLSRPGDPGIEDESNVVSSNDLSLARDVLLNIQPIERTQHHIDLARAIYEVSLAGEHAKKPRDAELHWPALVKALSIYGAANDALQMLYSTWNDPACSIYHTEKDTLVATVAQGLAREGRETDLVGLVEHAETHGVPYDRVMQEIITVYFAEQDRVAETQQWLAKPITSGPSLARTYRTVALFAKRNGLEDWAIPLFLELGQSRPRKRHWDIMLQAILLLGKSLDEVKVMMEHMICRDEKVTADIKTINGLLNVAVERRDPALADELLALAAEKELTPDCATAMAMCNLRLETGDPTACRDSYVKALYFEPWHPYMAAGLAVEFQTLSNRFAAALCRQSPPGFDVIGLIVSMAGEEGVRLEPDVVASVCLRLLENDTHLDVIEVLSLHSFYYSDSERELIQNAFLSFCLDPSTSTARAWKAYQLLQQFFQDTSFERRATLIDAFFTRKRADMAMLVFTHMRQHPKKEFHPTTETYIRCLEGLYQTPDEESLGSLHDALKLDATIQPDTKLFTALMLAFTSCGKARKAIDFWHDITRSAEGPSYASIEAMFWTLEQTMGGARQARQAWDRIERMDLEVPPAVFNAYVGAVATSGQVTEVQDLVSGMAAIVGAEPDAMT